MNANIVCTSLAATLALATSLPSMQFFTVPDADAESGVGRLYVIDCGDGSGSDESRWTQVSTSESLSDFLGIAQMLESSLAAVFAAGDIRSGNPQRVASAVGEGAISIHLVHRAPQEI